MASKISLGFVNDTHRGMRDTIASARQQGRGKAPPPPPQPHPPDEAPAGGFTGVVPVIETKDPPPSGPMRDRPIVLEPRDSNTFERRLEFVLGQVRSVNEVTGALQTSLRALEQSTSQSIQQLADSTSRAAALSASLLTVRGTCLADAPQFADDGGTAGSSLEPIAKGTPLVLAYPMVRDRAAVLMRRMNVDRHTAAVSWTWVVLYQDGLEAFVGDFAC